MTILHPLNGNSQKLDGGAMFGHVPKALWHQWIKPDEDNRITLACRALLIQESNRNILLETGIGAFFSPEKRSRYGVVEDQHVLLDSLKAIGLTHEDIDAVILSHLHFDHAGGLLSAWQENETPRLLFPNAQYLVSKAGWERACSPHTRDKASFIPELNTLLQASNRLMLIDSPTCDWLGKNYCFQFSHGHTPGLLHTQVNTEKGPLLFVSDLIPGTNWVHLPVGMGYDRMAELVIDEKETMLEWAIANQARLFYTHDTHIISSAIEKDASGKYRFIEIESTD